MILTNLSQGYMKNPCISYVNQWSQSFKAKGEIIFYKDPGNIKNLVDISFADIEGDVELTYYPHNNEVDVLRFCNHLDNPKRLWNLLLELSNKNQYGKRKFTIDLNLLVPVVRADFTISFIKDILYDQLFIFDIGSEEGGFPALFLKRPSPSEQSSIFRTQVKTSYYIAPVITKQTTTGKEFVYRLCNSIYENKFCGDTPSLSSIDFPTNPKRLTISPLLKTTALENLAVAIGKNISIKDGKVITRDENTEENLIPFIGDIDDDDDSMYKYKITKDIVDRGGICLSDLLGYGVKETIELITDKTKIIPIYIDFSGVVKRACIMEGFVYGILAEEAEWATMTGESDELFISCTEETIPVGRFKN